MKSTLWILSVIWISVGVVLLSNSGGCAPDDPSKVFKCLTPNELGDFLAGFFAPLAFLWLAAAVYIQSKELSEQRTELALTRKELELSREVAVEAKDAARAQAKEAQRSAEFFNAQTELMRDEQRRANEREAAEQLERLLPTARSFLVVLSRNTDSANLGDREWLTTFHENIASWIDGRTILSAADNLQPEERTNLSNRVLDCLDPFTMALELEDKLSVADQVAFKSLGIAELHTALANYHNELSKHM